MIRTETSTCLDHQVNCEYLNYVYTIFLKLLGKKYLILKEGRGCRLLALLIEFCFIIELLYLDPCVLALIIITNAEFFFNSLSCLQSVFLN